MGNRASIYIAPSNQTICLQWQGGPGSVDAFLSEAKKRAGFTNEIQLDFIFYLWSSIRDFFDFATDVKYRKRDQLSLYVEPGESICDQDNGHYRLDKAGELSREAATKYCVAEDPSYTEESNELVSGFFERLDNVLLAAEWEVAA